MQIILKDLSSSQSTLEVEPTLTVHDLKQLVSAQKGLEVHLLKLLFKGRILDDSKILEEYQITSGSAIVIVASKPKPKEPTVVHQDLPPVQPQNIPELQNPQPSEENISILVGMNFSREDSIRALSATNQDINRAIDFLLSGAIPELQDPPTAGTFDFLMQSPEFLNIVEIIRANPRELEPFLNQLETQNNELFELISRNQREFLELIRGAESGTEIELTKAEEDEIRELMALGFSAQDAIEAYLSSGKNKELAANLLFQNPR
ncbi:unnamed protein product [Blepharisma stoltei]|uniref:UV excision repair protein RAD23 n=1 Tax=Blepharisma stoltei TaxID=1481888 RepID=A0AAU9IMX7_9CILI|nr:unnamed protein product [Blepharisma stoltei]